MGFATRLTSPVFCSVLSVSLCRRLAGLAAGPSSGESTTDQGSPVEQSSGEEGGGGSSRLEGEAGAGNNNEGEKAESRLVLDDNKKLQEPEESETNNNVNSSGATEIVNLNHQSEGSPPERVRVRVAEPGGVEDGGHGILVTESVTQPGLYVLEQRTFGTACNILNIYGN